MLFKIYGLTLIIRANATGNKNYGKQSYSLYQ